MHELVAPTPAMIAEQKKLRASCPWYSYFSTPEIRRGYAKHAAFMAAGKDYRQRLFLSGNRCMAGDSKIDTPEGTYTIKALYDRGEPFRVFSWDGKRPIVAWAKAPFSKGLAPCLKITMGDGESLIVSERHRILTHAGWMSTKRLMRYASTRLPIMPWKTSGNRILTIRNDMEHEVFDFEVPIFHNYIAAGLVHHNSGKTLTAAFEMTCHLTGAYPAWWEGKRFVGPIEAWAGGDTGQTVRDIIQVALLGPVATMETRDWSGMIPKPAVYDVTRRPGLPGAASAIYVSRLDGKVSVLGLLSYDQGRETWQGTAKQSLWFDEEPPDDVYGEGLMRTMTTNGVVMVTMTPLKGLTPFVGDWLRKSVLEVINPETGLSELRHAHSAVFTEGGGAGEAQHESAIPVEELSRYTVMASWDDCPHLGEAVKAEMAKECPPHLLDARRSGVPSLGSGTIFPIPESEIRVKPFEIPDHWPRCWGADTDSGAGWTAAVWLAWDREANTYYVYDGFKRRHAEPAVHIEAIKSRGAWIPGVADAAGLAVTAHDSQQVIAIWRRGGLDVTLPDKSVEAGIQEVWELLSGGRLKIFANMGFLFDEYRLYRRDDKGRVVKQADHGVDSLRYCVKSGRARMKTKPGAPKEPVGNIFADPKTAGSGWMGA